MNSTTIIKPPVGQQVRITSMPGGLHTGKIGTVSDAYSPFRDTEISVTIDGKPMPHQNDCWIINGWEVVYPNVGDKVIPLPHNDNWYGIPDAYHNAVGTVTSVSGSADISGYRYVSAEFQSRQKPDDTINWSFYCWKPADGHTLTVSDPHRPAVGDRVWLTGYLTDDGITDGVNYPATVQSIDGDVWMVHAVALGHVATGPGYVLPIDTEDTPAVPVEPAIITDLQEQIDELTGQLARANERVEELRTRAGKWERDFNRYAEAVMQEAIDRDWCSEYERVMSSISGDLEIGTIPEREEDVDYSWEETYTVTVRRYGSRSMQRGYDSSDIDSAAREDNSNSDASRDDIIDAIREGNYSADEYVDDSAEEV
jgi:hypothetical protein